MSKFVKGLNKDTAPIDQPQGTWRYAKNMNIHPVTGSISNEDVFDPIKLAFNKLTSNQLNGAVIPDQNILPPAAIVIGAIPITDDRIILFITYDRTINFLPTIVDPNDPNGLVFSASTYGDNADPIYY